MRIPIREQLGALVLFTVLVALGVISVTTWVIIHDFVLDMRASRLSLIASLKASQLQSNIDLMQSHVRSAATRIVIQLALQRYNDQNNNTEANWSRSREDLAAVFQGGGQNALLLQAEIFAKNSTGIAGQNTTLVRATGIDVTNAIQLPGFYPNGSPIYLGDNTSEGYPPNLYPNFVYWDNQTQGSNVPMTIDGQTVNRSDPILIGPWQTNETFSLLSITLPINNNTNPTELLGWLTVVLDARLVSTVITANEGLDKTGVAMLVGPTTSTNKFVDANPQEAEDGSLNPNTNVTFKIPPTMGINADQRHSDRVYGRFNASFPVKQFPAVESGFSMSESVGNGAGSMISAENEQGFKVSVGYARPDVSIVDWLLLVEQSRSEVWEPINHLRNVQLAVIFGTLGAMVLFIFPVAHYFSRPIRRLRDATEKTISPPNNDTPELASHSPSIHDPDLIDLEAQRETKEGLSKIVSQLDRLRTRLQSDGTVETTGNPRRVFRIPGKVKEKKHFIEDELTELIRVFNEMSDELRFYVERLEELVAERTAELERKTVELGLSKTAAEAANESKTLFVANLSHELKTPLNGIMGLCAVLMAENDLDVIKRDLGTIYKSGDLLLHLLTDLLTFSKNQVGQHILLDEKEFQIVDIGAQLLVIFERQAKENDVSLQVKYQGPIEGETDYTTSTIYGDNEFAPFGLGKVKNMTLWGDQYRILQVLINLVSNSLKFTPKGGSIEVIIRCNGDSDVALSRRGSTQSKPGSGRNSRNRSRGSNSNNPSIASPHAMGTANEINPLEKVATYTQIMANERSASPPPGRLLEFSFEVKDNGPGIPKHLHESIFEPFVQGDLALSKAHGGTGLGLSICSQLAALMHGSIGLESEVDRGSTFTMTAPLRHLTTRTDSTSGSSVGSLASRHNSIDRSGEISEAYDDSTSIRSFVSAAPATAAGPVVFENDPKPRLVGLSQPFFASNVPLESPGSQQAAMERVATEVTARQDRIKVLVAEDNKTNQEVVLRMLKLEDVYDVTVAKDGQEAYDRVKESMEMQKPFHLVFMDVQMPNLDGLESTRMIRKTGYSAPIVALTAYSEESNVRECLGSGMDYFLSKPIRRPQLREVLKKYCPTIREEEETSTSSHSSSRTQNGTLAKLRSNDKPSMAPVDYTTARPLPQDPASPGVSPNS